MTLSESAKQLLESVNRITSDEESERIAQLILSDPEAFAKKINLYEREFAEKINNIAESFDEKKPGIKKIRQKMRHRLFRNLDSWEATSPTDLGDETSPPTERPHERMELLRKVFFHNPTVFFDRKNEIVVKEQRDNQDYDEKSNCVFQRNISFQGKPNSLGLGSFELSQQLSILSHLGIEQCQKEEIVTIFRESGQFKMQINEEKFDQFLKENEVFHNATIGCQNIEVAKTIHYGPEDEDFWNWESYELLIKLNGKTEILKVSDNNSDLSNPWERLLQRVITKVRPDRRHVFSRVGIDEVINGLNAAGQNVFGVKTSDGSIVPICLNKELIKIVEKSIMQTNQNKDLVPSENILRGAKSVKLKKTAKGQNLLIIKGDFGDEKELVCHENALEAWGENKFFDLLKMSPDPLKIIQTVSYEYSFFPKEKKRTQSCSLGISSRMVDALIEKTN